MVSGTGPITGVVVPAAATEASTVPAGTISDFSWGLVRPVMTGFPPARTSTAGAAAVCRTMSRPMVVGTAVVGFTNGVRAGVPAAVRLATIVTFSPAVSAAVVDRMGLALAGSPALRTAMACDPAGSGIGDVTVLKVKFGSALAPST